MSRFRKTKSYRRILSKLKHQYGRTWAGTLTPTEVISLYTNYKFNSPPFLIRMFQGALKSGHSNPLPFSLEVLPHSDLERDLHCM